MRTNTGSYLGLHPAAGIATVREKDRVVGPRRRAGRRPSHATARARSAKGTTVALLDGAARARWREGPWRRHHLHFLLSGRRERLLAARMREKGRERNELGFRGKADRDGVFIRRNGRTAVGFDPTAWNDRATQRPRRDATFPAQAQVAAWARVRAARAAAGPNKRSGLRAKQASGPNEQGEFSVYHFILFFRSYFE